MAGILGALAIAVVLSIPFLWIWRSQRRLTWTSAVIVGSVLCSIALILVGDVPSRMLYLFDRNREVLGSQIAIMDDDRIYIVVRDLIVNGVQLVFFVALIAAAYLWGERQRKAGRF